MKKFLIWFWKQNSILKKLRLLTSIVILPFLINAVLELTLIPALIVTTISLAYYIATFYQLKDEYNNHNTYNNISNK